MTSPTSNRAPTRSGLGALVVAGLSVVVLGVRAGLVWDTLPDTVATHFDSSGTPNGFGTKEQFIATVLGVHVMVSGLLVASGLLMQHIPISLLSLPEKESWIANGHLAQAREISKVALFKITASTGMLTYIIFELSVQANLGRHRLDTTATWTALGFYGVHVLFVSFNLLRTLKQPPRGTHGNRRT